jgi:hypothetical protein
VIVGEAVRRGVPRVILFRMALNLIADYLLGLVPVAGDIGDIVFRSNRKNLALLQRYSGGAAKPRLRDHLLLWAVLGIALLVLAGMTVLVWALIAWIASRPF